MDEELKIIIDSRELRSKVATSLYERGIKLIPEALPVGDFIVSDRVCVERKTAEDFISSIIDGRVFRQASLLLSNFDCPLMIVEGDVFESPRIHPNAVRGALASLCIDFRLPILFACDIDETVLFLIALAKREQIEKNRHVSLRGRKKPVHDSALQEHIVSSLPSVGASLAKNLLSHFKSVEHVFNASEEELKDVPLLGEKKSKRIKDIIKKEYK